MPMNLDGQRRVIGRIRELAALRGALDEARRGSPAAVVVVGPSGIGKSTLLAALADEAAAVGAVVLHGSAQEGLDIPYLPLASALSGLPAAARAFEGSPSPAATEADADLRRLDLFHTVTTAVQGAARLRPLVLLVDDVQWADTASVELLTHLSASVLLAPAGGRCGVVIAIAHRPVEGGPSAVLLDRLRRHPRGVDLTLRPLEAAESHALVHRLAGAPPSAHALKQLQDDSGGNPLVLSGLVRRHLNDGELQIEQAQLRLAPGAQLVAVRGDLDVDAQVRIDRLPEATQTGLELAASIGPRCSHAVLAQANHALGAVAGDLRAHLQVGAQAGIGRWTDAGWSFELDEVRRLLEVRGVRRFGREVHGLIADALEREGSPPPGLVLHHLLRATPRDEERLATWAVRAAEHAFTVAAWDQALAGYDQALAAIAAGGRAVGPVELADLHLRAGIAARFASDVPAAVGHLDVAARLARDADDVERWAAATTAKVRVSFINGTGGERAEAELFEVAELSTSAATRGAALAGAADLAYARLDFDRAVELAGHAVAVSRGDGDQPEPGALTSLGIAELGRLDLHAASKHLGEGAAAADAVGDRHISTGARSRRLLHDVLIGDLRRVHRVGPPLVAEMEGRGFWADSQVARCALQAVDLLSGNAREAEEQAALTTLVLDWVPYSYTAGMLFPAQAAGLVLRGDRAGADAVLARWEGSGGRGTWRFHQAVAVLDGEVEPVRDEVRRRPWTAPGRSADLLSLANLAAQIEVAAALGDVAWLDMAIPTLQHALERGTSFVLGWPASTSRLLGQAHTACGRFDDAARWLAVAREVSEAAGARAEQARVADELGRLDVATGSPRAIASVGLAAEALDGVGYLTLASDARRRLADRSTEHPRPRRRVVFCSDVVGSTELNVRLGDAAWAGVVAEHDRILRGCFRQRDGVAFKQTGDGFFAWFSNADDAVACALEVHEALERWTATHPDSPLHARVGLAAGAPVDVGDDLFGLTVVSAARLCGLARSGGVLLTDEVASWCGGAVSLVEAGERQLKGIPGVVRTFEALRTGAG